MRCETFVSTSSCSGVCSIRVAFNWVVLHCSAVSHLFFLGYAHIASFHTPPPKKAHKQVEKGWEYQFMWGALCKLLTITEEWPRIFCLFGRLLHFLLLAFNALALKMLSFLPGDSGSTFANRKNVIAVLLVASQVRYLRHLTLFWDCHQYEGSGFKTKIYIWVFLNQLIYLRISAIPITNLFKIRDYHQETNMKAGLLSSMSSLILELLLYFSLSCLCWLSGARKPCLWWWLLWISLVVHWAHLGCWFFLVLRHI